MHRGTSWTTDAPYGETEPALRSAADLGIQAVEMEAASLYAFAEAPATAWSGIAHVTKSMAVDGDDYEKGEADGTHRILTVTAAIADSVLPEDRPPRRCDSGSSRNRY